MSDLDTILGNQRWRTKIADYLKKGTLFLSILPMAITGTYDAQGGCHVVVYSDGLENQVLYDSGFSVHRETVDCLTYAEGLEDLRAYDPSIETIGILVPGGDIAYPEEVMSLDAAPYLKEAAIRTSHFFGLGPNCTEEDILGALEGRPFQLGPQLFYDGGAVPEQETPVQPAAGLPDYALPLLCIVGMGLGLACLFAYVGRRKNP